jgi:hypothetical protein
MRHQLRLALAAATVSLGAFGGTALHGASPASAMRKEPCIVHHQIAAKRPSSSDALGRERGNVEMAASNDCVVNG